MEDFFPTKFLDLLIISITLSFVIMVTLQKFKVLPFINSNWEIWILNLILSFGIGIPFAVYFYNLDIYSGLWVGLFTFVGAPSIYDALKKQTIINYTPTSLSDSIKISKNNEIKRDDL